MDWITASSWSLAAASLLMAELGPFPMPELGNASATAILGWYAWHTAARTIPRLVRQFRDEMSEALTLFREERQRQREDFADLCAATSAERLAFREELVIERRQRSEEFEQVINRLTQLAQCLDELQRRIEQIDVSSLPPRS